MKLGETPLQWEFRFTQFHPPQNRKKSSTRSTYGMGHAAKVLEEVSDEVRPNDRCCLVAAYEDRQKHNLVLVASTCDEGTDDPLWLRLIPGGCCMEGSVAEMSPVEAHGNASAALTIHLCLEWNPTVQSLQRKSLRLRCRN